MPYTTLLDIIKANSADPAVGLIDETIKAHPELTLGAARTIKGTKYETLVRTSLGRTTGSFRNANEGTAPIKHTYENRLVSTYIMEPRFEIDKAVADSSEDGAAVYIATQATGVLEGEMQGLCTCFYYGRGTKGNAKAFPGLIDAYDATNMVVDAGGTTANTGSSVWLVKFGPQAVQWVWGNSGQLAFSPVRVESITDPNAATQRFDGYVQTMVARPGLQVGSLQSLVRIKKLTADAGKGLTDALINQALAKFPTGTQPDVVLMTRRSLQQLQASRTATSDTGKPAPFPTEIAGIAGVNIPIRATDALIDTEPLTLEKAA
jgi:hypothetical protein